MINELERKEYERKRSGTNYRYYPGIWVEGLRKTSARSPGRDLKPGPPEYEVGVLPTRPRCPVRRSRTENFTAVGAKFSLKIVTIRSGASGPCCSSTAWWTWGDTSCRTFYSSSIIGLCVVILKATQKHSFRLWNGFVNLIFCWRWLSSGL
jgi:hypothetical protein